MWTRRQFLQISGATAAALGVGALSVMPSKGHASFDDWRALPGMIARLTLEIDHPETKRVHIVAQTEREQRIIESYPGASVLDIRVPFVRTSEDSFMLYAVVTDHGETACISEPLEVLVESFQFGL